MISMMVIDRIISLTFEATVVKIVVVIAILGALDRVCHIAEHA